MGKITELEIREIKKAGDREVKMLEVGDWGKLNNEN